jgi:hypothetical protein
MYIYDTTEIDHEASRLWQCLLRYVSGVLGEVDE